MKVLQISSSDVIGSRFNGYALRQLLAENDIQSHHLVWNKLGKGDGSSHFFPLPFSRQATAVLNRVERVFSMHSRLQLQSFTLPLHPAFKEADLVHYHIIHDGYFSLTALPWLSRLKPSIWTIHDPWLFTGHCIYPVGCERWQIGCGQCPRLDLPFKMYRDRTAADFRWKQDIVQRMSVDLLLASESMRAMATTSAITRDKKLHVIPFGIDLAKFAPNDGKAARHRIGISPDRVVISVRAFPSSPFKGFDFFIKALRRLDAIGVPLTIVTTNMKGELKEFSGKHQIIDLGWVNDETLMLDSYHAADLFIMPSVSEAFGMMAIEAMAVGKPVIVFDGTSLPDITGAPEIGLAVPNSDDAALAEAIQFLVTDKKERQRRGDAGRALALQRYDERVFAQRMADLYRSVKRDRVGGTEHSTL